MPSITNQWIQATRRFHEYDGCASETRWQMTRPPLTLASGLRISVQAGDALYSSPRNNTCQNYAQVECGFPSEPISEGVYVFGADGEKVTFEDFKEVSSNGEDQTECIFPYTPIELVDELVRMHGGLHIRCTEIVVAYTSMQPNSLTRLLKEYDLQVQKLWNEKIEATIKAEKATKVSKPKTWEQFKRTRAETFYGCVDKEGNWFDSAEDYSTAVHWCVCHAGRTNVSAFWEAAWMEEFAIQHGYSIVHSTLLKKMYEAGCLK